MKNKWRKTEEVIDEFKKENKDRCVRTLEAIPMYINPKKIIAINNNYAYPEILNDHKMVKLKDSFEKNEWTNENIFGFSLIMLPNGDLLVNGGGNHRAVLSKELQIPLVKAMVAKVEYYD